jgi:hypothetical protein
MATNPHRDKDRRRLSETAREQDNDGANSEQ